MQELCAALSRAEPVPRRVRSRALLTPVSLQLGGAKGVAAASPRSAAAAAKADAADVNQAARIAGVLKESDAARRIAQAFVIERVRRDPKRCAGVLEALAKTMALMSWSAMADWAPFAASLSRQLTASLPASAAPAPVVAARPGAAPPKRKAEAPPAVVFGDAVWEQAVEANLLFAADSGAGRCEGVRSDNRVAQASLTPIHVCRPRGPQRGAAHAGGLPRVAGPCGHGGAPHTAARQHQALAQALRKAHHALAARRRTPRCMSRAKVEGGRTQGGGGEMVSVCRIARGREALGGAATGRHSRAVRGERREIGP